MILVSFLYLPYFERYYYFNFNYLILIFTNLLFSHVKDVPGWVKICFIAYFVEEDVASKKMTFLFVYLPYFERYHNFNSNYYFFNYIEFLDILHAIKSSKDRESPTDYFKLKIYFILRVFTELIRKRNYWNLQGEENLIFERILFPCKFK